jgi:S1-C subfamily serine protease
MASGQEGGGPLRKILAVLLVGAMLPAFCPVPAMAQSQSLDDIFNRVSPTVVVVRAKGRDVNASGITRFNETGSGVLISSDGRVMTASHVVNGMDEITVEGVAGEVVRATLLSADAAADVALLQRVIHLNLFLITLRTPSESLPTYAANQTSSTLWPITLFFAMYQTSR